MRVVETASLNMQRVFAFECVPFSLEHVTSDITFSISQVRFIFAKFVHTQPRTTNESINK